MDKEFNEEKYNKVIQACQLINDFKKFNDSDLTEISENGENLSGGQKHRISLARAMPLATLSRLLASVSFCPA